MSKILSINAGQILTGPLFNEPMRVETVRRRAKLLNDLFKMLARMRS
jgi:hypothetical protein